MASWLAATLVLLSASTALAQRVVIIAPRDSVVTLAPVKVSAHSVPDTFPGSWPASARRAMRDSIAAGRRRWERNRPERYVVAAYMQCGFCSGILRRGLPAGTYPAMRVLGREAVGVGSFHPADSITGYPEWIFVPVEGLFALAESELTDTTRRLDELRLDPVYGFPVAWTTNATGNGYGGRYFTDAGYSGSTVYFAPAPPPEPCAGFRRLFARCAADPYAPRTPRTVSTMAKPTWDRLLPHVPRMQSTEDRSVRVRYIVDSSGFVVAGSPAIVSASDSSVAQAVMWSADVWTFRPATLHGAPVSVRAEEVFVFRAAPHGCPAPEEALQIIARDTLPDGVPRTFLGCQ